MPSWRGQGKLYIFLQFCFEDTNPSLANQWTTLTTAWLMFMASSSEFFGGCVKINMEVLAVTEVVNKDGV